MPSASAMMPAIASMTSVNDVRDIDCVVRLAERLHSSERKIRVDGPDGTAYLSDEILGSCLIAADGKRQIARDEASGQARMRPVLRHASTRSRAAADRRRCRRRHQTTPMISFHAPDASDANPFAECRRRLPPQLTRQVVRHDRDPPAVVDVGPREIAPRDQRNSDRPEKARRNELGSAQRRNPFRVASCLRPSPPCCSRTPSPSAAQWRRRLTSRRNLCRSPSGCPAASARHVGLRDLPLGDRDAQRLDARARRIRARRFAVPGSFESSGRPRPAARPPGRPARTRARSASDAVRGLARACGHRRAQRPWRACAPLGPAYFTTGMSPKSSADRSDTASVNASTTGSIEISARRGSVAGPTAMRSRSPRTRAQSQRAAQQREREAFDKQMTRDVTPARAQRRAQRELLPSSLRSHQQQIGNVRAGDHQDDADGSHQQPEHRSDVADDIGFDRPQGGPEACSGQDVGVRAALTDPDRQHAADIGVGLSERHARLQSGDSDKGVDIVGQQLGALKSLRQNHCRFGVEESERLRHDADHFARPRVDRDPACR